MNQLKLLDLRNSCINGITMEIIVSDQKFNSLLKFSIENIRLTSFLLR